MLRWCNTMHFLDATAQLQIWYSNFPICKRVFQILIKHPIFSPGSILVQWSCQPNVMQVTRTCLQTIIMGKLGMCYSVITMFFLILINMDSGQKTMWHDQRCLSPLFEGISYLHGCLVTFICIFWWLSNISDEPWKENMHSKYFLPKVDFFQALYFFQNFPCFCLKYHKPVYF